MQTDLNDNAVATQENEQQFHFTIAVCTSHKRCFNTAACVKVKNRSTTNMIILLQVLRAKNAAAVAAVAAAVVFFVDYYISLQLQSTKTLLKA